MSFRAYLILMACITLLVWAVWGMIVFNVNPLEAGTSGLVLFFVTLGTALIGSLSLLGILFRVFILKRQSVMAREVKIAFRHAVLLSTIAVVALSLSARELLHWWILIVLIACACVIEYLALTFQSSRRG